MAKVSATSAEAVKGHRFVKGGEPGDWQARSSAGSRKSLGLCGRTLVPAVQPCALQAVFCLCLDALLRELCECVASQVWRGGRWLLAAGLETGNAKNIFVEVPTRQNRPLAESGHWFVCSLASWFQPMVLTPGIPRLHELSFTAYKSSTCFCCNFITCIATNVTTAGTLQLFQPVVIVSWWVQVIKTFEVLFFPRRINLILASYYYCCLSDKTLQKTSGTMRLFLMEEVQMIIMEI